MNTNLTIYTQEAINAFNTYILSIQKNDISIYDITCPTGQIDDLNTTCLDLSYNGSYGNKTTTGYYVTYNITLDQIENLINFQVSTEDVSDNESALDTYYISDSCTLTWQDNLIISGYGSGTDEEYTPGYEGCVAWGTTGWKKSCWKSLFGTKYCVLVPSGWGCIEKGWIAPVETGTIPASADYKLSIAGITGSGTYGYYLSSIKPVSTFITYYAYNVINDAFPNNTIYYVYNLTLNIISLSYKSYTISSGNFLTITSEEVSEILNYVFNYQQQSAWSETLNNTIYDTLITITINPTTNN